MNIGVVLVTFNRLEKLKTSLEHLESQSLLPKHVVIVDNASTDGTSEYLSQWCTTCQKFTVQILTMPTNCGGSGGYYAGMDEIIKYPVDWVWLQDDDVYADKDAFAVAMDSLATINDPQIVSLSSKVITKGEVSLVHRRYVTKRFLDVKEKNCPLEYYKQEYFKLDLITFAGAFISKSAIEKVGLPEKDFFIWQDDTEYCYRLLKIGSLYCVPNVVIEHDVDEKQDTGISWKSYYGWRNEMIKYQKHFSVFVYSFKILKRLVNGIFFLYKHGSIGAKVWYSALFDGIKGVRGLHAVYKPGWKP